MQDSSIIALFEARDQKAIAACEETYGKYCYHIGYQILQDDGHTCECVNDTWFRAWQVIPPEKPKKLSIFLGRIMRNLSIDLYRKFHAKKRGAQAQCLIFEELSEVLAGQSDPQKQVLDKELTSIIETFLRQTDVQKRDVFLARYWFHHSTKEIAKNFGMKEGTVKSILSRLRAELRDHLEKEVGLWI